MNTLDKKMIRILKQLLDIYKTIQEIQYDLTPEAKMYNDIELKEALEGLERTKIILTRTTYRIRNFWVKH